MTPETPTPAVQADSCDDCGHAVDDHDLREGRGCNVCAVGDPCGSILCDTCVIGVATTTRTEGGSTPVYRLCDSCATGFDAATSDLLPEGEVGDLVRVAGWQYVISADGSLEPLDSRDPRYVPADDEIVR